MSNENSLSIWLDGRRHTAESAQKKTLMTEEESDDEWGLAHVPTLMFSSEYHSVPDFISCDSVLPSDGVRWDEK